MVSKNNKKCYSFWGSTSALISMHGISVDAEDIYGRNRIKEMEISFLD